VRLAESATAPLAESTLLQVKKSVRGDAEGGPSLPIQASRQAGPSADLVAMVVSRPEQILGFDPVAWDVLIRQARRANLLARLAWVLRRHGLWDRVLPAAQPHLESAWAFSERQRIAVQWEIECIARALRSTGVPLILLKGAAYGALDLPAAAGRLVSDLDILVPKDSIAAVESQLMIHGWNTIHHDAYDQRYYRRWMHEIPPMRHLRRGTVIDVHHALLPETARVRADSEAVRRAAVGVPGRSGVYVLSPTDMVLHSATHLFHEGELDNGLRDLVDLDSLLRHFGEQSGFWDRLVPRASEVGLARPLFYALRYAQLILGTPVPAEVIDATASAGPSGPLRTLMDALFLRSLRPNHPTCSDGMTRLARWLLYVRAHWLRMPVPLLLYHLTRKAVIRTDDAGPQRQERPAPPAGQ
jgi:hypothetical protein